MHCISPAPLCSTLRTPCSFSPAKWPSRSSHSLLRCFPAHFSVIQLNIFNKSFCPKSSLSYRQSTEKASWGWGESTFQVLIPGAAAVIPLLSSEKPAGCQRQPSTQQGHPHAAPVHTDEWPDVFERQLFSPSCSLNSTVGKADKGCIASSSVCCLQYQTKRLWVMPVQRAPSPI